MTSDAAVDTRPRRISESKSHQRSNSRETRSDHRRKTPEPNRPKTPELKSNHRSKSPVEYCTNKELSNLSQDPKILKMDKISKQVDELRKKLDKLARDNPDFQNLKNTREMRDILSIVNELVVLTV